jgi:hypothetical protein
MATGRKMGGREKGTPNKVTKTLREMILGALDAAGGQEYLTRQAEKNPTAFMTLLGKVLPTTIAGDPDNPVEVGVLSIEAHRERAREIIRQAFEPLRVDEGEPRPMKPIQ